MAIDPDALMAMEPIVSRARYEARDTILYALGVGLGHRASVDPAWLRFVYEDGLQALPTMAVVLASPGFWMKDEKWGADWRKALHGEQSVTVHRPIEVAAHVRCETSVEAVVDKGPAKGALVHSLRRILSEDSGDLIAEVRQSLVLRGDGGCGSRGEDVAPVLHAIPDRAPDIVQHVSTRPEQAMIYRLSGDYNPLHISPGVAEQAGFPRPVLHGLSTYGVAGAQIVADLCGGDPARMRHFYARFSSPVLPGETLSVQIWREEAGKALLQVRLVERDIIVLNNGYIEYET